MINIHLSPQLEEMVRRKIASGLYDSASEVIREALCLMEAQDRMQEEKLELLRQEIREGLESGDPTPWNMDEFLQEARRRRVALKREEPEA